MEDRLKAFWLGIFIIVGIAITAWLFLFLKPSAGNGELTLKVLFSNIDKVEVGTRVTFAGKPVGEVKKIQEVKDPRQSPSDQFGNLYIFELTLKVDSSVQVYTYDEIVFASSGLLGEKSIAIIPKATPPGAPSALNITHDLLFGRSTDKLESTLNQLTQVAETFGKAMEGVNHFVAMNSEEFNNTLKSIHEFMNEANNQQFMNRASLAADAIAQAMRSANGMISEIHERGLISRMAKGFDQLYEIGGQITQGEGTLGRLIYNDAFYHQLTDLMWRIDNLVSDINNYGLLFQYDKKWQRCRRMRFCTEMIPAEYCQH